MYVSCRTLNIRLLSHVYYTSIVPCLVNRLCVLKTNKTSQISPCVCVYVMKSNKTSQIRLINYILYQKSVTNAIQLSKYFIKYLFRKTCHQCSKFPLHFYLVNNSKSNTLSECYLKFINISNE